MSFIRQLLGRRGTNLLWMLLLLAIPVTSFPLIAERFGDVAVSPLSVIPLLLLVPLFLIPDLWRGGRLPFLVLPLLLFVLASGIAAGAAYFLPIEPMKSQTVLSRELRAGVTLFVGIAFYLCASRLPTTDRKLRWTLWAIYLGGILALIWATFQANYVMRGLNNVPQHLNEFHRWLSVRDLERNRVTGLAFEPSWLADQLVVLYLPLWLGAVLTGRSLLALHRGPFSLELLLVGWGSWILLMTRSRVGIAGFLGVLALAAIWLCWRAAGGLLSAFSDRHGVETSRFARLALRLISVLLVGALMVGIAYVLLRKGAQIDYRMRRVLRIRTELPAIEQQYPFDALYEVANRFAFAERLVYWRASLHPFEVSPIVGVGPGNTGFYFAEGVPAYGYQLVEIRSYLDPTSSNFPNAKNLWIRLLSESGLIGFAAYSSWLLLLLVATIALRKKGEGTMAWLSVFGMLSLAAQVVEGFSLDSYGLPQIWVANGLITACLIMQLGKDMDADVPSPHARMPADSHTVGIEGGVQPNRG